MLSPFDHDFRQTTLFAKNKHFGERGYIKLQGFSPSLTCMSSDFKFI